MARLYWITGTLTAARDTRAFIALASAASEVEAIGACTAALRKDWSSVEVEAIRVVDPERAWEVDASLREAIHVAQSEGVCLLVSEQKAAN